MGVEGFGVQDGGASRLDLLSLVTEANSEILERLHADVRADVEGAARVLAQKVAARYCMTHHRRSVSQQRATSSIRCPPRGLPHDWNLASCEQSGTLTGWCFAGRMRTQRGPTLQSTAPWT